MPKYRIYAGLKEKFNGPVYQGTFECGSQVEANWKAYDIAWEVYESYGGKHGLLDRDAIYERLLEQEWIDPREQSEVEVDIIVDDHYREQIEKWIVYKAILASDSETNLDDDEDAWHDDDDVDCYCDD